MDNNSERALVRRACALISAIAFIGLTIGSASSAWPLTREKVNGAATRSRMAFSFEMASASNLVQGDVPSSDDDKDVPPKMVEKYTNAYKAMQKDHNMTADQAAAAQGLTIAQFRSIEGRIERDDTLRERVRKALRNATAGAKGTSNQ